MVERNDVSDEKTECAQPGHTEITNISTLSQSLFSMASRRRNYGDFMVFVCDLYDSSTATLPSQLNSYNRFFRVSNGHNNGPVLRFHVNTYVNI